MREEILQLIKNRRKEALSLLNRKKKIKPAVYFFVRQNGVINDIALPGTESFFSSKDTKNMLPFYIKSKWAQYNEKLPMTLVAVVLMSDIWTGSGLTEEGERKYNRDGLDTYAKRQEAIMFCVYQQDIKYVYLYPYKKVGKHFVYYDTIETESDTSGGYRFNNLWPL